MKTILTILMAFAVVTLIVNNRHHCKSLDIGWIPPVKTFKYEREFVIDSMRSVYARPLECFPECWEIYPLDSGQVIGSFNVQYSDFKGRVTRVDNFLIYWDGRQARQREATKDDIDKYQIKPEQEIEIYSESAPPIKQRS